MRRALWWVLCCGFAVFGCHRSFRPTAVTTATQQLSCPESSLQVVEAESWAFHVVGCGQDRWLRCHGHRGKVCCRSVATEGEARATFAPHANGGHVTGDDQYCE